MEKLKPWILNYISNKNSGEKGGTTIIKKVIKKGGSSPTPPTSSFVVPNGFKFAYSTTLPEDFANWDFSNVTNASNMFSNSSFTTLPLINVSSFEECGSFLAGNSKITTLPILNFNNIKSMDSGFSNCSKLSGAIELNYKFADSSSGTWNFESLFGNCSGVESIKLTFGNNQTSTRHFTTSYMFSGCSKLKSVDLTFTNSISDKFQGMFRNCTLLEDVPVIDMSYASNPNTNYTSQMFNNCTSLTNQSLDNILQSCITIDFTNSSYKNLTSLSLPASYDSIIPTLPHYNDFIAAGWSIR